MNTLDCVRLFENQKWQEIADNINTLGTDPSISRALVVFNPSEIPYSGTVVFKVDMPWRSNKALPKININHHVSSGLTSSTITSPILLDENIDKTRIQFDIVFEVLNVPSRGWDTYIASYSDDKAKNSISSSIDYEISLRVVETTIHPGNLPSTFSLGNFPSLNP
jgi:hypothetical protein